MTGTVNRKEKHWMAIYTRPRSEKKVAERLADAGVEIYCPLQTTIRQWSDRRKKVKIPVFPSYVFVHVAEPERRGILMDPGVLNFVYWLGKPAIIRDDEISFLKAFLKDEIYEHIDIGQFREGDKVDIVAGPFSGNKGTVQETGGRSVTILLESLGTVLKVKLKPHQVFKPREAAS